MCKSYLRKFTPLSENSYLNLTPTLMCNLLKIQGREVSRVQEPGCAVKILFLEDRKQVSEN